MDTLLSDARFAVRALVARPGFSALAVLTLAIGIGVNAVAFNAINALLYKPFRFPGVETLGWVVTRTAGNPYNRAGPCRLRSRDGWLPVLSSASAPPIHRPMSGARCCRLPSRCSRVCFRPTAPRRRTRCWRCARTDAGSESDPRHYGYDPMPGLIRIICIA